MSIRVLIKFSHGLGDCAQFTAVLKHLRIYRPDWVVDVISGRGKHTAFNGLCNKSYHDKEESPEGRIKYDRVIDIGFFENYNSYPDRPNSKITNCLQEVFGLNYNRGFGRYEVGVSPEATSRAAAYLRSIGAKPRGDLFGAVILHYQGNTSPVKKNLGHWQAQALCDFVLAAGRVPIILDWDKRSSLPDNRTIFCPNCSENDIWGGFGTGDAETIAALIRQVEGYIGIDSGPGKIASSTDTPTLICWMGHHPVQFHDPAENTVHLVPKDWAALPPCAGHPDVADYFRRNYQFTEYPDEHGLVAEGVRWLTKILNHAAERPKSVGTSFVLPNGIGDVMWALHKIRSIAADQPIDIILSGDPTRDVDQRAVPFLKHFKFVRSVQVLDLPVVQSRKQPNDAKGRYRYVPDGKIGTYHFLVPNTALECGQRLEEWLPDVACDWKVIDEFSWEGTEKGKILGQGFRPFVAFYLGPETGNVDEGHNRGFLWEPKHWIALGKEFEKRGLEVVLVGAYYDRTYWERYVRAGVVENGMHWVDLIGKLEIGETFALLQQSRFFVSYQCGLGIVHHYLGGKGAMWWRPEGDSCHAERLVSFDERMASGWVNPAYRDNYIGLIYKRETVWDILAEVENRGWL